MFKWHCKECGCVVWNCKTCSCGNTIDKNKKLIEKQKREMQRKIDKLRKGR